MRTIQDNSSQYLSQTGRENPNFVHYKEFSDGQGNSKFCVNLCTKAVAADYESNMTHLFIRISSTY